MIMSNYEIYRSVRSAEQKREQVKVLAELNGTSKEKIIGIYHDYDKRQRESDREYRELLLKAKNSIPTQKGSARRSTLLAGLI